MRNLTSVLVLGVAALGLATSSVAAAAATQTIHLTAPTANMHAKGAWGAAKVQFTKHDVSVNITAEKLPDLMALHAKYYVAWLAQANGKKWYVGSFMPHNGMGGASAMLMVTKFQKVVVTAENSKHPMHAMGQIVLSGTAMMTH
jgi:hypothetical protein